MKLLTRINVVDPEELTDEHLRAEYREITRIPNHIIKVNYKPNLTNIPDIYTLGTGHVRFFYDKMRFIEKRFMLLHLEMKRRKFKNSKTWNYNFPDHLNNDYSLTEKDKELNRKRLKERWPKNPHYMGIKI